jgi:protein phosphatase
VLDAREAEAALGAGVRAVLDLTAELDEAARSSDARALSERAGPRPDRADPRADARGRRVRRAPRRRGEVVYVHCKIGYSRSARSSAPADRERRAATADAAIESLRAARPTLVVRAEAREAIEVSAAAGHDPSTHRP